MIENPDFPGPLDSNQLDTLRLEVSSVSPSEASRLKSVIGRYNQRLISDFGEFIPTTLADDEAAERFLFMDRSAHEVFTENWLSNDSLTVGDTDIANAITFYANNGNLVLVASDLQTWNSLSLKNKLDIAINFRGFKNAKKGIEESNIINTLSHELTHLYQTENLDSIFSNAGAPYYSLVFKELGAYYYSLSLIQKDKKFAYYPREMLAANVYSQLIERYGDDVHRLFFGQEFNPEIIKGIVNDVSPDIVDQIFPDYQNKIIEAILREIK